MIDTYCITWRNRIIYIGQTSCLRKRINRHRHNFKNESFPLYLFMRTKSRDPNEFRFEVMESNHTLELATHSERYWIKILKPIGNKQVPRF